MPTYIITGANRGLGLELVRQLSQSSSNNTIIALVRSQQGELSDLKSLASDTKSIHIEECDTSSAQSIKSFGRSLDSILKKNGDGKVDYLFNNAGIATVPEQTSLTIEGDDLRKHIDINVMGPADLTKVVAPHLRDRSGVVMNTTSGLGSFGRALVRCTTYAISKAALNMLTVHQAADLKPRGIKVICMDPGWVKTRMGGDRAILEPQESIEGMLKVVYGLKESDSGKFYQYDGQEVPW